jgi:hypothetical protein
MFKLKLGPLGVVLTAALLFSCPALVTDPTFSVIYHSNQALIGPAPTDGTAYNSGDSVVVLGVGSMSYPGNAFAGWNTAANGGGTSYSPGDSVSITADLHLYAQWSSTGAPFIKSAQLLSSSMNTTSSSDSVTIVAGVQADYGVAYFSVGFLGPNNTLANGIGAVFQGSPIYEGTNQEGTFTVEVSLPQGAPAGEYNIYGLGLIDYHQNHAEYNAFKGDLVGTGWENFSFTNHATSELPLPEIDGYAQDKTNINTTSSSESLTATVQFQDSVGVESVSVYWTDPNDKVIGKTAWADEGFSAGTATDGAFEITMDFPQYAAVGEYSLTSMQIKNTNGISRVYLADDGSIAAAGFSGDFTNSATDWDTGAPTLIGYNVDRSSVNTEAGTQFVTFTIQASDDKGLDWGLHQH